MRRVVSAIGYDGTQKLIDLIEAGKTAEQAFAELMPFIERSARQRKEARANG